MPSEMKRRKVLEVWIGVETGPRLSTTQVIVLGKKP